MVSSDMERELHALRQDIVQIKRSFRHLLADASHSGNKRITALRELLAQGLESGLEHARHGGQMAATRAHKTMKDYPIATALTALGLGALLGGLVVRRR